MKRILSLLIVTLLLCGCFALGGCSSSKAESITLNVYNWGEYISDGSEGTLNVNKAFEEYYEETYGVKVTVNYSTYASNEDMYNKIKSGATSYDVIFPSDYMIARMANEDMLAKLDFSNIPNFQYINESHKNMYYDPGSVYSVPYTYGVVGVIYNSTMVDEEDIGTWEIFSNKKYERKILQFNNPRDALGTAMYALGISVNTTDHSEWDQAAALLKEQKPLVQSYVMDEIFNKMKNGSAAISAYYAGDYLSMYEDNEYLEFYYPEEGTNIFVDAMCIPVTSPHKEVAERYINFMLEEEIAVANAEYTYYASPNTLVTGNEEYVACMEDIHENAMEILYPEHLPPVTYYENLDPETLAYVNTSWESLKLENSVHPWVYIFSGVIIVSLVALILWKIIQKNYRRKYYYQVH